MNGRSFSLAALSLAALLACPASEAATNGPSARMLGGGRAVALQDLPADGLRGRLERLSEPAQHRAMGWLQRFEFPEADVRSLRADGAGGVFYACEFPPAPAGVGAVAEAPAVAAATVPVAPFPDGSQAVDFAYHVVLPRDRPASSSTLAFIDWLKRQAVHHDNSMDQL